MTAFSPSVHRLVATTTLNLADAAPVDTRDFMVATLNAMKLSGNYSIGGTAPADTTLLWYNPSTRGILRWNGSSWATLQADPFALHMLQRAFIGAAAKTTAADTDQIPFYSIADKEVRKITFQAFRNLVSGLGGISFPVYATLSLTSQTTYQTRDIYGCSVAITQVGTGDNISSRITITPAADQGNNVWVAIGSKSTAGARINPVPGGFKPSTPYVYQTDTGNAASYTDVPLMFLFMRFAPY